MSSSIIVSIDIGISNLAYCILERESDAGVKIGAWKNVNLKEDAAAEAETDRQDTPPVSEKKKCMRCRKKAVFEQAAADAATTTTSPSVFLCAAHANDIRAPFCVLPNGWRHSAQWLTKKTKTELHAIEASLIAARSRSVVAAATPRSLVAAATPTPTTTTTPTVKACDNKNSYIASIMAMSPVIGLTKIAKLKKQQQKKQPGGRTADYVRIGRNMKRLFDETMAQLLVDNKLTHVVIETQMTAKMKTVQGMVMQYFIMRSSPSLHVEFVSPVHKLKHTTTTADALHSTATPAVASSRYRQNKLDGVRRCYDVIKDENNHIRFADSEAAVFAQMQQQLTCGGGGSKMKLDDFADAFLQGWWYLTSSPNCR